MACAASIFGAQSAALAAGGAPPPGPIKYSERAAPSDSFADSVGFVSVFETHTYPAKVTQELEWSGIRHLRDGGPPTALLVSTYAELGRHGIKHAIGMLPGFAPATLVTALNAFAPYVDYVEGANEQDNFAHPNFPQIVQDQKTLWNTVRSNRAYASVQVAGPSFANPTTGSAGTGPTDAYESFGVLHNATCDYPPSETGSSSIAANILKIRASTVYKPVETTETGYGDNFTRGCSLPDDNIARYVPRESALRFMSGMPRTYYDFLVTRPNEPAFGSLGMLQVDGTPKPQFLTLASLVQLTADLGPAIPARSVSYAISGTTPDVQHLMLARRDGSYEFLIWREVASWDHHLRAQIPIAPENAQLQLPAGMLWAGMFKTSANYGLTRTQLPVTHGVTAIFPVDDKITVLHIYGSKAASASAIRE